MGGGHNGLVAAAYLARAGLSVTVLEAGDRFGGAVASAQIFDGVEITLSRFSYLVSLLPQQIIDDLELDLDLRSRRIASYTPVGDGGLLVERRPGEATRDSFAAGPGTGGVRGVPGAGGRAAPVRHRGGTDADRPPPPGRGRPRRRRRRAVERPGAAADRRADRAYGRRRHRPRHPAHRRPDRHLRQRPLTGARAEPLLPLPRGRQRHRGVEGAGRRHGHGGGGAGDRGHVRGCRAADRRRGAWDWSRTTAG